MGLQVTKNVMGREQVLYLKIDALTGNKDCTDVVANYYWDRDCSSDKTNAIASEQVTMHFDRNATGNPFAIAYSFLKEHLALHEVTFQDIDAADEEAVSNLAPDQSDEAAVNENA